MINKIIDGISMRLNEVFGDEYDIYSEDVKQGLKEPCFFILTLNPSSRASLGKRSFRKYNFDIHYFPKSKKDKNKEINDVIETLTDELEYITLDDSLTRGSDINAEIVDDVLHFFISYNMFINKFVPAANDMETLEIRESLKR